jgi:serine/threonine protein kinase
MSPEVLRGEYTSKVDVWSVGVLAFMLLSSSMPFYGSTRKHVIQRILKGHYSFKSRMWKYVSDDAKMFVKKCLTFDPKERPTADEALHLPWLQNDVDMVAPELDSMDLVQASMQSFSTYGTLKKLALMVIAHKSTSDEIGFLRRVFDKYDTTNDGVIAFTEFRDALHDYDYSEEELTSMFEGIVSRTVNKWRQKCS